MQEEIIEVQKEIVGKQIFGSLNSIRVGLGPRKSHGLSYILMDALVNVSFYPHNLDHRLRLVSLW